MNRYRHRLRMHSAIKKMDFFYKNSGEKGVNEKGDELL